MSTGGEVRAIPVAASESATSARPRLKGALELLGSAALLALTVRAVDVSVLQNRLASIELGWLALGILLQTPQLLATSLRWWFTAGRMGAPLRFGTALREYFVSALLNQLLPGGIAGDALRIKRHGDRLDRGRTGYALCLRTVLVERLAGQWVLWLCIAASLPLWLSEERALQHKLWATVIVSAAVALVVTTWLRKRGSGAISMWIGEARAALFERQAYLVQLASSALSLACLVATFACSARALGASLSVRELMRIVPLALASMSLPVSFAGWGLREAATAGLYGLSGLDPSTGTAVSMLYGVMGLVGSLPGVLFLRRRE